MISPHHIAGSEQSFLWVASRILREQGADGEDSPAKHEVRDFGSQTVLHSFDDAGASHV